MHISPDNLIYWQKGFAVFNATIAFTWIVMGLLALISWIITRRLTSDVALSRGQNLLESIVLGMVKQIREISRHRPARLLPFLGTLFLFVAASSLLSVIPGFEPPTGSLSTTAAMAICVFVSVPVFGISRVGLKSYLKNYVRPNPLMLPFNVMGEISRTMALAVRLFGNIMSGTMIAAILLSVTPLVFPVVMQLFGLLTGLVQAYIFAVLAAVYISAGMEVQVRRQEDSKKGEPDG